MDDEARSMPNEEDRLMTDKQWERARRYQHQGVYQMPVPEPDAATNDTTEAEALEAARQRYFNAGIQDQWWQQRWQGRHWW